MEFDEEYIKFAKEYEESLKDTRPITDKDLEDLFKNDQSENTKWQSPLVIAYSKLYLQYSNIMDKLTFMINLYFEYKDNHYFEIAGDPYLVDWEDEEDETCKLESEARELSDFIYLEFKHLQVELNENKKIWNEMQIINQKYKDYIEKNNSKKKPKPKPTKTPKILNTELDILFDRLTTAIYKGKPVMDCSKIDYNKLFNGSEIEKVNLTWNGSIGLLKNLFAELNRIYKFSNPYYYKDCFQFTQQQYINNKPSTKDIETTTKLLS